MDIKTDYKDDGLTHRAILFLCGTLYPLWSVFLRLVLPHAYDRLSQRFIVGGICLVLFFLVGRYRFFRKRSEHLAHAMIFVLSGHFYYLAYYAQMSLIYVIGSLVVSCALSVLFFNRFVYTLFSVTTLIVAFVDVTLLQLHSDTSFMLLAGLTTVHVTFFIMLSARNRAIKALAELRQTVLEMRLHEAKTLADILEKKAHYDTLTEIANRTLFFNQLAQNISFAKRHGTGLGLLFIDLDGFKPINDKLGHEAGDYLLRVVAKRLTEAIRASDIAARIGGDEFTVILPATKTPEAAQTVCDRIIEVLGEPILIKGETCKIGASIGIALLDEKNDNEESLLAKADQAMYQAKSAGKNRTAVYVAERKTAA